MRRAVLVSLLLIGLCACKVEKAPTASDLEAAAASDVELSQEAGLLLMDGPQLLLAGDGMVLVNSRSQVATPLKFGAAKAEVLTALARGLGRPADKQETLGDCGPGPLDAATWSKGLSVYFQNGRFVGWGGAVKLQTDKHVGAGSTLAELKAAYPEVKVETTSLGEEFTAGDLSGVLDSRRADARVSELWAGMTCVAR